MDGEHAPAGRCRDGDDLRTPAALPLIRRKRNPASRNPASHNPASRTRQGNPAFAADLRERANGTQVERRVKADGRAKW
jgi:hypothetical protein